MTKKQATNASLKNEQRRARRQVSAGIERRECEDKARRKRLEATPEKWLAFYLSAAFPLPFGQVHRDMIGAAVRAIRTGAGMACAAPRGTGKSTVLFAVALWAVLSGECRFPVVAGWSHSAARRLLRKWLLSLSENARLAADYPEVCGPFETSTHANRLKGMYWQDTGEPCGADVRITDGALVLPDGMGALGAISVSGSSRGLFVGLPDGSSIRPDVLFLDDPQDKATGESEKLSKQTCERIEADLFSMSGPDVRLSVLAAVTVVSEKDVATHFLSHPDFEAIRVSQIATWPDGWAADSSPVRALWDVWNETRTEGLSEQDGGKAARSFYRKNKPVLIKGMAVSWPARFDKKRKDPDASFAAMWDFYRLGERAFMAERQNNPLPSESAAAFELPVAHVAARVNGLAKRTAPESAVALCGMVDINADGLRWGIAAATNARALSIVDYGIYPGGGRLLLDKSQAESVAIMRGLDGLHETLSGLAVMKGAERMPLDLMLVDCGGPWMQTVFDWLAARRRRGGISWLASRGWGSRGYRPGRTAVGRPGDGFHLADWPGKGRVLVHNADLWRHRQQKGWLLPVGAPDSVSFYGADRDRHEIFADSVCCERLAAYAETDAGPLYKWNIRPGYRNDWGDVATGLFVAAARLGLTPTAGGIARPKIHRRPRARERVTVIPI